MKKIVIIDSHSPELAVLVDQIEGQLNAKVIVRESVEDAKNVKDVAALILSIQKSVDDYTPFDSIPTILITGTLPVNSKQFLLANQLMDTVADYSHHNCRYIISLLRRVDVLMKLNVLVFEDENLIQSLISRNLSVLGIQPVLCSTLKEVSSYLKKGDHTIHMALVSVKTPEGLKLVQKLRQKYNKLELPIIAMLSENDPEELEIEFLRNGTTDSIVKKLSTPLSMEQFRSRIMHSMRQVISYIELTYMAERDFLTGCFNRRYFFDAGESLFANFQRGNFSFAVAMIDIDNFKKINDTYGHPAGDLGIISLANQLQHAVRKTDLVARFGGEEFCIILAGADHDGVISVLERIRKAVEECVHRTDSGESFSYTVSIGVTVQPGASLEKMVNCADKLLYKAKNSGKNRVVSDI